MLGRKKRYSAAHIWRTAKKAGRVQQGDKVLVMAAAGDTGQIAVQWAKQLGAYVMLTSTSAQAEYLRSIGADYVINYQKQDLDKVLQAVL